MQQGSSGWEKWWQPFNHKSNRSFFFPCAFRFSGIASLLFKMAAAFANIHWAVNAKISKDYSCKSNSTTTTNDNLAADLNLWLKHDHFKHFSVLIYSQCCNMSSYPAYVNFLASGLFSFFVFFFITERVASCENTVIILKLLRGQHFWHRTRNEKKLYNICQRIWC